MDTPEANTSAPAAEAVPATPENTPAATSPAPAVEAASAGAGGAEVPSATPPEDAGHEPKKKKKKKKASGPSPVAQVGGLFKDSGTALQQMSYGLFSPDWPTRRMSILFILSVFGVFSVFGVSIHRYVKYRQEQKLLHPDLAIEQAAVLLAKQQAEELRKDTISQLGDFTIEIKNPPDYKHVDGVVNMAEIEIRVQCDLKETCQFIDKHLEQMRNQVIAALVPVEREVLLTREGKKRIRRAIVDQMNLLLPHGKVEDAYFANMVIN